VFAWFIGTAVLEWQASNDVVVEAVTNHTRATLGNRLTDVASSDQHTVKPWLSARLDYSPPVRDLATDGFPLVGGRLDYLDRHPVATLVYRYRQHTIDVFVRPLTGKTAPVPAGTAATLRGFNVALATGSGMEWWAVSDVSADVLEGFVARLASGS
jgi:anti-sigma factor RsiW